MNYYIGIDVGGTKTSFGLFDENKKLIYKDKIASDDQKNAEQFFGEIVDKIRELQAQAAEKGAVIGGVGIGVPGFVDFERGYISKIPSLPKLGDFEAADFIRQHLGSEMKVILDNDGHCGALAEFRQGIGKGRTNMLYCPVSTGISTGMILNGRLFRGSNGASGESGHMLACIPEDEKMECMCGNTGCFNSLASGKAILNYVRKWIAEGEDTCLVEMAGSVENITTVHLSEAYDRGDKLAIKAVNQMAHYLAVWIFNVYMLLNVDCIVFSGGLLAMGDKLMGRMKEEFESYHTNGFPVEFHEAMLGNDSALIGAMELIFD